MAIIRTRKDKDNPYKCVNTISATDTRLSIEARGMMFYLLSRPDDWDIRVKDLMRKANIGRDKAYRILAELQKCGYVVREQDRLDDGAFGENVYVVYEVPLPEKPEAEKTDTNPIAKQISPLPEKPHTVNQEAILSIDREPSMDLTNNLFSFSLREKEKKVRDSGKDSCITTADPITTLGENSKTNRETTADSESLSVSFSSKENETKSVETASESDKQQPLSDDALTDEAIFAAFYQQVPEKERKFPPKERKVKSAKRLLWEEERRKVLWGHQSPQD